MVSPEAAERFIDSPLLAELDAAARAAVLNVLGEERAETGAILLEQGHENDHIAFLIEGSATVLRRKPNGRAEVLTTLTAPAVFGLTSFFRPVPPNFSVRADSPVWLLTFNHEAHDLLRRVDLRAAEELALFALRVMADRFDLLDRRISQELAGVVDNAPKHSEWMSFRAKLFDESAI